MLLWANSERATGWNGSGTLGATGTVTTLLWRKFDLDDLVVPTINRRRPAVADMSFGANSMLGLPINGKLADIKARRKACLPFVICTRRANDLDAKILGTVHQIFACYISSVEPMIEGQQITLSQVLVDFQGNRIICTRCSAGFNMSDEVRSILITRFRQVNLVG